MRVGKTITVKHEKDCCYILVTLTIVFFTYNGKQLHACCYAGIRYTMDWNSADMETHFDLP